MGDFDDITERKELSRSMLTYLSNNPNAKDTLEGIVQWWIQDEKMRFCKDVIEKTLDELVARDMIIPCLDADSRVLYRLNKSKYEEIRSLLASGNC